MTNRIDVLDHGYVELVEHYGSDARIIEAARMSTNKGFLGWGDDKMYVCPAAGQLNADYRKGDVALAPDGTVLCLRCSQMHLITPEQVNRGTGDEKLLRYLYEHKHMTPFEMAGMIIEVQAPIFVFREWHRHRTQSYNEMSARYVTLPAVDYMPSVERIMMKGGTNKQAQALNDGADEDRAKHFIGLLTYHYSGAEAQYQVALSAGVPKELARIVLPVGRYSRMRASANLRNWLAFLTLRMDNAAQWEIRQYANAVGTLIAEYFPRTWSLFGEGIDK